MVRRKMPNNRSVSSSGAPSAIIIGAGFGGIAMAIELQRHGYRELTILESADDFGGTWLHNTYPGAACDIPSQLYSFSYEQRRDWVQPCTAQPEILRYARDVAHKHGLDRRTHFGAVVAACEWDDAAQQWEAVTDAGDRYRADTLIVATGQLNHPAFPAIPGRERFAGTAFHSARWDHDAELAGKRVAVIGTGASAVQFVPPVAEQAAQLTVFQRTGNWFMPRRNHRYRPRTRWAIAHVPGLQRLRRLMIYQLAESITRAIRHPRTIGRALATASSVYMRWQLRGDAELRRKVWPDYTFGCKRVLFSSYWFPALRRENVTLETERITEITERGLVTADGREHEFDVLIYGTGFRTNDFMLPMQITGRDGTLQEAWSEGAHAHLGMTVPGFPSLFLLYGPNTNTSGGSIITFLEAQAGYVRQALDLVRAQGGGAIEVRQEVEAASDRELQAEFSGSAWLSCDSWYRDASGRIVTNWPRQMHEYVAATRTLAPGDFQLVPAREAEPAASTT